MWNCGERIPKGTILGEYKGSPIMQDVLEKAERMGTDSGYTWEIMDEKTGKLVGGVDPGSNPSRLNNPLAFVNCGKD